MNRKKILVFGATGAQGGSVARNLLARRLRRPRITRKTDLADMFEFYRLHIPSRAKNIEKCRAIAPELQSFDTWLAKNEGKLKGALGL